MNALRAVLLWAAVGVLALVGVALGASGGRSPRALAAAVCADYPNQAAAQRAADTRDADGDGVYCESLPCPCSSANDGGSDPDRQRPAKRSKCVKPRRVQPIGFSATKYPHIRRHVRDALAGGWPRVLVLNRRGADARRERLLEAFPTRDGYDRDEYPPAVAAGAARASRAGATRPAGRPTSSTCRAPRTGRTARSWASSCGASATAPASRTSSTDGPPGRLRTRSPEHEH